MGRAPAVVGPCERRIGGDPRPGGRREDGADCAVVAALAEDPQAMAGEVVVNGRLMWVVDWSHVPIVFAGGSFRSLIGVRSVALNLLPGP